MKDPAGRPPKGRPASFFVAAAVLHSVSTFDGLSRPWDLLAARLQRFQLHTTLLGVIHVASGIVG